MPGKTRIPRPFVKWAGGKDQLLTSISQNLPKKSFSRYFEPFLGGGAVFFFLYRMGDISKAYLSDLNSELITAYSTIKNSVEELISELESGQYKPNKTTFYKIRKWDRAPNWKDVDRVTQTSRMIYLNKTCYNGLYRVNKDGYFNVPYGRYKNPKIVDEKNLRAVSKALKKATLSCTDFKQAVKKTEAGDFIYFDPPYDPLNKTASFTSYTTKGFGEKEQESLANIFHKLTAEKRIILESNSNTALIKQLYSTPGIFISEISAKRAISCDPNGRGAITELLIRNYLETRQKETQQKKLVP